VTAARGKGGGLGSILDLFAQDAQVTFPKWGIAEGHEAIGRMFAAGGPGVPGPSVSRAAVLPHQISQSL
jgi:hypothetical protein